MMTIEYVGALASAIDNWSAEGRDPQAVPEIVRTNLEKWSPSPNIKVVDIQSWIIQTHKLSRQLNNNGLFGQPPVTLARKEGFVIDVYFWIDGTTNIHEHQFEGRFRCCKALASRACTLLNEKMSQLIDKSVVQQGKYSVIGSRLFRCYASEP
jgi:hypothetical protein